MLPGLRLGAALSDRVTVANNAAIQDVMPVTFLVVVAPTSLTANRCFFMKGSAAGASRKYIRIDASSNIGVLVDRSTTDTTYGTNSAPLVAGVVNYIGVTIDTSASPVVRIYHGLANTPMREATYGTTTDGSGTVASDSGTSAQLFNVFAVDSPLQGDCYALQMVAGILPLAQMHEWQRDGNNPVMLGSRGAWDLGAQGQVIVRDKAGYGHGTVTGAVLSPSPIGRRAEKIRRVVSPVAAASFLSAWARGSNAIYQPGVC